MAGTRKRALHEAEPDNAPFSKPPSLLQQIRNMWQFANLFQFIMLFGKALKMDDNFDIEVGRYFCSCRLTAIADIKAPRIWRQTVYRPAPRSFRTSALAFSSTSLRIEA